jgi:hypothetical protein
MRTLDPSELTIPRRVLERLPPRPFRYGPHQELFQRHTGLVFDAVAPATAAADATLQFLFNAERAARMVQQKALDAALPGLDDVIGRVRDATFGLRHADDYEAEVSRAVERVFVDHLVRLAGRAPMPQVRAVAQYELEELAVWMAEASDTASEADRAHFRLLSSDIGRFLERPHEPVAAPATPNMPPGSPIGQPGMTWMGGEAWGPAAAPSWVGSVLDLSCSWH